MEPRRVLLSLAVILALAGAAILLWMSGGRGGTADDDATEGRGAATSAAEVRAAPGLALAPQHGARRGIGPGPSAEHADSEAVGDGRPWAAVEGVVVDEAGRPVGSALVHAAPVRGNNDLGVEVATTPGSEWAVADAEGRFSLPVLEGDELVVSAEGPAWAVQRLKMLEDVRLKAPAKGLRLVVARLGTATMRGLRPDGTYFVGLASVDSVKRGEREEWITTVETKDGAFYRYGIEDHDYVFRVHVEGFAPVRLPFRGRLGADVNLGDVLLDVGVTVHGQVTDATGASISGAKVGVGPGVLDITTDSEGGFTAQHVPREPFDLFIGAKDYLPYRQRVDAAKLRGTVTATLLRGGFVDGLVRNSAGIRVAEAENLLARALGPDGTVTEAEEFPATIGSYMSWRLPAGRWRIAWRPRAAAGMQVDEVTLAEWTLAEGEKKEIDLALPAR